MGEEREYGLEDGYRDGAACRAPIGEFDPAGAGEYEIAYREGYDRALAARRQDGLP